MNKPDFKNEFERLWRGFNRHTTDLSPERLEAAFAKWGSEPLDFYRQAVDSLLCDDRYPSAARVNEAIGAVRAAKQENDSIRDRATSPDRIEPKTEYGRFRAALLVRQMAEKMSPRQVGEALMAAADRFPEISKGEVEQLIRAGDSWEDRAHDSYWDIVQREQRKIEKAERQMLAKRVGEPANEDWFRAHPDWFKDFAGRG